MTTFNFDVTEYVHNEYDSNYTKVEPNDPKVFKIKVNVDYISDDVLFKYQRFESGWISLSTPSFEFEKEFTQVNYMSIFIKEGKYIYEYEFLIFNNKKTFNIHIKNGDTLSCVTVNNKQASSRNEEHNPTFGLCNALIWFFCDELCKSTYDCD
jgi:hypothetical protein